MKNMKITLTALSLGLILGISTGIAAKNSPEPVNNTESTKQFENLPLDDIQRFTTAIKQIKSYYVEPIDDEQLFEDAIRGMLTGLDPHSNYLDIDDFEALRANTNGEFGGLGIEVGIEDGYIKVISPIDDTPAHKAGLKSGDLIIRIDNKPTKGMSLRKAVTQMRGKKGSEIQLTIFRKDEEKLKKISIVRDVIQIQSVKSKTLDEGYGYIRITNFQTPTGNDLRDAVNKLKKSNNNQIEGIILDLRNNPGGLLDASIQVSDAFLEGGKLEHNNMIVYTKGRLAGSQLKAKATPGDIIDGAPIVILINEGSASASEIVAGALQDHQRAIVMGNKTFGKGSVQTILPLDGKRGVKLTTALYYTPSGRSIQAEGIEPDIEVDMIAIPKSEEVDDKLAFLTEADLDGHLENGNNDEAENNNESDDEDELLNTDFQLHQALNLLKGLNAIQARN